MPLVRAFGSLVDSNSGLLKSGWVGWLEEDQDTGTRSWEYIRAPPKGIRGMLGQQKDLLSPWALL